MNRAVTLRIVVRFGVLVLLCSALWGFSGRGKTIQQGEVFRPVVIGRQLEPVGGVIPAEIKCGLARLSAANELAGFDCKLKNNTIKNITAAAFIESLVVREPTGNEHLESVNSGFDTLISPDLVATSKAISPGEEISLGPPGPRSFPGATITEVRIAIDFVEFDDNTTMGPNEAGSRMIRDMRQGAAKYKEWIVRKFNDNGAVLTAIIPLLQKDQSLPGELNFASEQEETGARLYRNRLDKVYRSRGYSELDRVFRQRKN